MVDRRAFLLGLTGGLLLRPAPVRAQAARRPPRIGWLTSSVVHQPNVEAFRQGMLALDHRAIGIEFRAAEGQFDRLAGLAAELVTLDVDVIVTDGGPAAVAAGRATSTMPIVIGATAGDLVREGLVNSLSRPGGNVTGLTISTGPDLYGKRLELLREALPSLTRVAAVWNPRNEANRASNASIERAGRALGVQVESVPARNVQEIERGMEAARARVGAMLVVADAFLWSLRARIAALAARHRLPAIYPETEFAEAVGLMAYGPNVPDNFRRAAAYVDKILKGAKPADLPIEQPTKFELLVNLRAAKGLGLVLSPSLLHRADRIIE